MASDLQIRSAVIRKKYEFYARRIFCVVELPRRRIYTLWGTFEILSKWLQGAIYSASHKFYGSSDVFLCLVCE